ncbi:MAG: glycosyltransferase family 39 protein [Chitinophagaceae bacterium]|nr:glycosyltransferase family 39 protein [Chitinophagaceae bacterium]
MIYRIHFFIFFASCLFFLSPVADVRLFDWDEINFAECAREMLVLKKYSVLYINYAPFWEKPPFFVWMQYISFFLLGISEYTARLPNAICGIITIQVLFSIGKLLYNTQFGILWCLVYLGSILPHFYFRTGIIDPFFNLFIFVGIFFFLLFYWKKENFSLEFKQKRGFFLIISGIFIGMALITKGPVAYLICILCLFVFFMFQIQKRKATFSFSHFLIWSFFSITPFIIWIGIDMSKNGVWLFKEFMSYQLRLLQTEDAGHSGFLGYHFVILLLGCSPASFFTIPSFFQKHTEKNFLNSFTLFMKILFWVVLVLFSIVNTKIIHYSSLAYFPLTFLSAKYIFDTIEKKTTIPNFLRITLLIFFITLGSIIFCIPFMMQNIQMLYPYIQDDFAKANFSAAVNWDWTDGLPGLYLIILIIAVVTGMYYRKTKSSLYVLFFGMSFFIMWFLSLFPYKIESYTQGAAVDFYTQFQDKEVYVTPIGFKSYAHLFYGKVMPHNASEYQNNDQWVQFLLEEEIDKDAYFCAKINDSASLQRVKHLEKISEKNGFVFFLKRKQR